MKIIICGATGFIGRNLLEHFSRDQRNEIIAINFKRPPLDGFNNNVRWVNTDLRLAGSLKEYINNTDLFLQFAATTSGANDIKNRPYLHVTDNAVMNSHLLRESFESHVKHFIFPSCTVMLASLEKQKEEDWDESTQINPTYFGVGNTKIYIEKMCKFYSNLGMKTTVIRHSNVFGPYDKFDLNKSHVLGATIRKVINSPQKGELNVWGTGKARRDFIYIKDLISFIEKSYSNQTDSFGLYNCGMGESISINKLAELIIRLSGKDLDIFNDISKPDIPTALSLDCSKALEDLGWEIKSDFTQSLELTYRWAENNINIL
ncbi:MULTISPECIES: NAD-dependent epimerase/dehydratase family protein [unclassified Prochlorococcus]|uniref:NAD-dependent epimerase/dehydratase family protein n=1 Tax=unclassified Prochlorococcus TaxID=2627481 RepID=UPI0005337B23|nr:MULTISPECIES: NAD-dependent epimerase/dehydratase family protein [unclassified Prochlorococcus]KGG16332.1 NolK [Prochlorococcus sp. MIT 0603]KGG17934.1 NolK [Prochlorococcus sp. MIT 0602]